MTIDLEKAVALIGYPVSHPELDDFLQASGIERRLTAKDRPLASVGLDNESVQLQFTDAYEDTHGPARAPGFLVLEDVTVENGKYVEGAGDFTGVLPFGLRLDMTETDIAAKLGEPHYKGEFLGAYFMTYDDVYPGVDLKFRLNKTSREISFVRFFAKETA